MSKQDKLRGNWREVNRGIGCPLEQTISTKRARQGLINILDRLENELHVFGTEVRWCGDDELSDKQIGVKDLLKAGILALATWGEEDEEPNGIGR